MIKTKEKFLFNIYKTGKVRFNYWLDRIIDLADLFLMDVYRLPWLPAQKFAQFLARFGGDLAWLLRDFPRLPVLKFTGPDWSIIFVGSEKSLPEIKYLFFKDQEVSQLSLERVPLWQLKNQTKRWLAKDTDLVICELSRIFPFQLWSPVIFSVPTWIQQELELPESLDKILTGKSMKTIRHDLNRAQKARFSWYFSQSKEDFDLFYHQMYRPFIESRHQERSLIATYNDQWRRWFVRGGLIIITQNQKPVAGLLCYLRNKTFYAIEGGVLNANMELLTQGIKVSSTWFGINWAHQHDAKIYNMGGTRPLRSDGVFFTKSRWRTQVTQRKKIYGVWTFLGQKLPPKLQAHINELGFISEIEDKFCGVFLTTSTPNDKDNINISQGVLTAKKQGLAGMAVVPANGEKLTIYE